MNLTKAQRVRLGAFLITGGILIGGGILTLAGLKVWERRDEYTIRFNESVSGLSRSSQVKFQGLQIGRVEEMMISPDDPGTIEIVISLAPETPLFVGAVAELDTSGLTGLKTVNIRGGDPRKGTIKPGTRIPSGESFFGRVTGQAEQVMAKAEVIANQIARWTGPENQQRVEDVLDGVNELVAQMTLTLVDVTDPMTDSLTAIAEVSRQTVKFEGRAMQTLDVFDREFALTAQSTRRTLASIERTANAFDEKEVQATVVATRHAMENLAARLSEAEAGVAIHDLQRALKDTVTVLQDLDLVVRAGREDLVSSLGYIRAATEDLREFSRIIAQDPSVLLRGRELSQ